MAKGFFRVLVALSLAGAAGCKKLNGIHRFLGEGYDWDSRYNYWSKEHKKVIDWDSFEVTADSIK